MKRRYRRWTFGKGAYGIPEMRNDIALYYDVPFLLWLDGWDMTVIDLIGLS